MGCTSSVVGDAVSGTLAMDPRPEPEGLGRTNGHGHGHGHGTGTSVGDTEGSWATAPTTGRTTFATVSGRKSATATVVGYGRRGADTSARNGPNVSAGSGADIGPGDGSAAPTSRAPLPGHTALAPPALVTMGDGSGRDGSGREHALAHNGVSPSTTPLSAQQPHHIRRDTPEPPMDSRTGMLGSSGVGGGNHSTRRPADTRTTTPGTVGLHFGRTDSAHAFAPGSTTHSRAASGTQSFVVPPHLVGGNSQHNLLATVAVGSSSSAGAATSATAHSGAGTGGGAYPHAHPQLGVGGSAPGSTLNLLSIPSAKPKPQAAPSHFVIIAPPPPPPPRKGSPQTLVLKLPPHIAAARDRERDDDGDEDSCNAAPGAVNTASAVNGVDAADSKGFGTDMLLPSPGGGVGCVNPSSAATSARTTARATARSPPKTNRADSFSAQPVVREAVRASLLDSAFGLSPAGPKAACEVCLDRFPKGELPRHTRTHVEAARASYVQQLRTQLSVAFGFGGSGEYLQAPSQAAALKAFLDGIVEYCLVPATAPPHVVWHELPPRIAFDEAGVSFACDLLRALPAVVRFAEHVHARPQFADAQYLMGQCLPLYVQFMSLSAKLQFHRQPQRLCPNAAVDVWWQCHMMRPAAYRQWCLARFGLVVERDLSATDPLTTPTPAFTAECWLREYNTPFALPEWTPARGAGAEVKTDASAGADEGLPPVSSVLKDRQWLPALIASPHACDDRLLFAAPELRCNSGHVMAVEYTRPSVIVAGDGTRYIPSRACSSCRNNVYAAAAHWYRCGTCDEFACRPCARALLIRCRRGHGMSGYKGRSPPSTPPSPKIVDLLNIPNYKTKQLLWQSQQLVASTTPQPQPTNTLHVTLSPHMSATVASTPSHGQSLSNGLAALTLNSTRSVGSTGSTGSVSYGSSLASNSPLVPSGSPSPLAPAGLALAPLDAGSARLSAPLIGAAGAGASGGAASGEALRPSFSGAACACDRCGEQNLSSRTDWYHCESCGDADYCEPCADQRESYSLYALKHYRRFWFFARRFPETARLMIRGARLPPHIDLLARVHQLVSPHQFAADADRDCVLLPDRTDAPVRGDDRTERARRDVAKRFWADTFGADSALF